MSLSELFKGVVAREAERWRCIISEAVLKDLKGVTGAAGYCCVIVFSGGAEFDRARRSASEGYLISVTHAFSYSQTSFSSIRPFIFFPEAGLLVSLPITLNFDESGDPKVSRRLIPAVC
jgi:hypothetical protein